MQKNVSKDFLNFSKIYLLSLLKPLSYGRMVQTIQLSKRTQRAYVDAAHRVARLAASPRDTKHGSCGSYVGY